MEKIIEKISQYHLLNAFLPGIAFVYLSKYIAGVDLLTHELAFDFFVIYMYGLICSRIGSLLVEPILRKIRFIRFAQYEDYLNAVEIDKKITELNADNNFYRTMVGTCLSVAFLLVFKHLMDYCPLINDYASWILLFLCFLLFLFSYRKQTKYISRRVDSKIDRKQR